MKSANILKTCFLTVFIFIISFSLSIFSTQVLAYQLDSTNYRMVGVSTSGGGGVLESANFSMLSELGRLSANPRNYSSNYRMHQDPSAAFVAAQPSVQCFETDTAGTTDCISGPQELLDGGMVAICGGTGCHDKARFEIEGVQRMVPSCTGGDVTEFDDYYVHAFTEDGTFSCNLPVSVDVLVVGGGGGGGAVSGGGGGAGGLIFEKKYPVNLGSSLPVVVGSGGNGGIDRYTRGENGENSIFSTLTAIGGGGGGSISARTGLDGGSGGGANSRPSADGGSALLDGEQGSDGGDGVGANAGNSGSGSGGGGFSEPGDDTPDEWHAGDGGSGKYLGEIFSDSYGDEGWFAGGGGGGYSNHSNNPGGYAGVGGNGGGGDGRTGMVNGENGLINTGGGGGGGGYNGASWTGGNGGNGGSGIVLVRVDKSFLSQPIGFWGLDEPSGTGAYLLDYSGNDNHGTPTGTTFVEGIIGGARSFNGTSDYISIPDSPELRLDGESYTIMAWINHDPSSATGSIVSKRGWVGGSYRFRYDHTSGPRIRWHGHYGGTTLTVDYNTSLTPGEWHHIGVTAKNIPDNKVLVTLYHNGQEGNSAEVNGTISGNTEILDIGSLGGSAQQFNGIIDDVRIFDRALSEGEILQEYEYGIGKRSNPPDTLYTVYISEDNFVSDTRCIDGSTFRPKNITECDINDFRTREHWENEVFNIKGLKQDTTYYIKISALHGDFTQSDFSKIAEATTSTAHIFFDIDIATDTGFEAETSPPHTVSFAGPDELVAGAAPVTASSLIWLDVESSSSNGMAVVKYGEHGGLYSPTTSEIILSTNTDLNTTEGFGLQSYYIDYEESTFLGEITAGANYTGSGNVVGEVATTGNVLYSGNGPINDGRMGIYLKAKADLNRTPAPDYTEFITFILVPIY